MMNLNSPKTTVPQIITRSGFFASTKGTKIPSLSSIPLSSDEFYRTIANINKIQNETFI